MPSLAQLGIPTTISFRPTTAAGEEGDYPRPQLRRPEWTSLNGLWEFAIDFDGNRDEPEDVTFDQTIEVPFAPETARSGIHDRGLYRAVWYRREVSVPPLRDGDCLLLHLCAVDYEAFVYVDGALVGKHEGGYTPFTIDVTAAVRGRASFVLCIRAIDDPADLAKPRGKQDWLREPHSIWYPRTTGIWQTVWLEAVPRVHIAHIRWTPSLQRWELGFEARVCRSRGGRFRLRIRLRVRDVLLADDTYMVVAEEVHRRIALSDPGIDDFRNALLWSPESPTLIAAELTLLDESGEVIDRADSYTALRSVAVQRDRFVLNGRPYPLRLVLDQGYWPETGMTAPDCAALRRDVELAKAMGFNGVRKHQKIEDPRYLYWADRLGLLVWGEMPSAYRFTRRSVERLSSQWAEALARDVSHPCIVAWVPFNESWGVPNLPDTAAERDYVKALYHLTKALDPTRPVIGNDGWESSATDILGIHDYDWNAARIARRYLAHELVPKLLQRERPGGRLLVLEGHEPRDMPLVLSEFGGIAFGPESNGTWGYSRCKSAAEFKSRYTSLLDVVGGLELFAGFCYTQFADTYQEANGLLYADRTPKLPLADIARATTRHAAENGPDAPLQEPRGRE